MPKQQNKVRNRVSVPSHWPGPFAPLIWMAASGLWPRRTLTFHLCCGLYYLSIWSDPYIQSFQINTSQIFVHYSLQHTLCVWTISIVHFSQSQLLENHGITVKNTEYD